MLLERHDNHILLSGGAATRCSATSLSAPTSRSRTQKSSAGAAASRPARTFPGVPRNSSTSLAMTRGRAQPFQRGCSRSDRWSPVTDSLFETPPSTISDRRRSNATSCAGVRARMDGWWTVAPGQGPPSSSSICARPVTPPIELHELDVQVAPSGRGFDVRITQPDGRSSKKKLDLRNAADSFVPATCRR
jgi:hypothetical protein